MISAKLKKVWKERPKKVPKIFDYFFFLLYVDIKERYPLDYLQLNVYKFDLIVPTPA